MSDRLLDVEPIPAPAPVRMSADRRRTARQHRMIADGLHPLGGPIHGDATRKCGNCIFRVQTNNGNKAWWKCAKHTITNGPATDLRISWPACNMHCGTGESVGCPTCHGHLFVELTANDWSYHRACPWNWTGRGPNRVYVGPKRKRCGTCLGTGVVRREPSPSLQPSGCGS